MRPLEQTKAKRFRFLNHLYEHTGGDKYKSPNMFTLGEELGFDRDETGLITQYLEAEGLIKHTTIGGGIGITHFGVLEVERALSAPEQATTYFPAVNIINVRHMENSQIQQGSNSSTQNMNITQTNNNDLEAFIQLCKEKLPELNLEKDDESEVASDLATIESQLSSSRPKPGIIGECLGSIKRVLEGASGSLLAQQLATTVTPLIASYIG